MKISKKSKRVYVTVTLPEVVKDRLDQWARATKRNRGVCVEMAIEQFLKGQTN